MKLQFKKALAALVAVVMMVTSLLFPSAAFAKTADNKYYKEGEVIAVLNESAGNKYMKATSVKSAFGYGYTQKNSFTFGGGKTRTVVLKSANMTTKQMLKDLKKNPAVKYALPNYIKHATDITNDTYSEYQWALDNTGQNFGTAGDDVNADALWADAATSETEQVVAIVDTGIDANNEDLKDVLWNNPYGTKLLGKHGRDFTGTIDNGEPTDDNGHGSHCAGIIAAAADNEKGISGINKSNVKIMALKFLDSEGSGYTESALAAYEYLQRAIKLGTNVIACNNSWGGYGDAEEKMLYDSIYDELGKLGVITFAAAGNECTELGTQSDLFDDGEYYDVPACCDSPYCITVAATNEKDELADFSNYSAKYVDVAAPGTEILSTVSYNCFNPTIYTAAQKANLCTYTQDYEATVNEGDFGYMKKVLLDDEDYNNGTNYDISYVDGFGLSGKAMQLTFKDEIPEDDFVLYSYEIPFTLSDENKNYSVSVMSKGTDNFEALIFDVPASVSAKDALSKYEYFGYLWGMEKDNFWDHTFYNVDMEDDSITYKKDANRKLVVLFAIYKQNTTVTLDDLAISSQDASADDFGKYDFYCGTSMATPYATGAAALIKNARPDATTLDVINMIKNTGRYSAALEGKTANGKVLSLENIDVIPPLITDVAYNEQQDVDITGSFRNVTAVTVNDEAAEVISTENNKITIKDKNYGTKKITVKVESAIGADKYDTFISAKPTFNHTKTESKPETFGTIAVPAGSQAYFVGAYGTIGSVTYDDYYKMYNYSEVGMLDLSKVFDNEIYSVSSATYCGNCLYMTVLDMVMSEATGTVLGYETALVKYDPNKMTTTKICELPDESVSGASLAVYNGEIYLIGGMDFTDTLKCLTCVYKLNEKAKTFEKQDASLPEGRASARFLQYKDKLVGIYGCCDGGKFPSILVFDGTTWTAKQTTLESDDVPLPLTLTDGTEINNYEGNVGYGYNGIVANGSYIYGVGDTFTYNPDTDKVTAHKCSSRNSLSEPTLVGTTVPGSFIGFGEKSIIDIDDPVGVGALMRIAGVAYDDIADVDTEYDPFEFATEDAYYINLKNAYPQVDVSGTEHGYASTVNDQYYNYGDRIDLKLSMEAGWVTTSIKNNGTKLSTNSNTATLVVKDAQNVVTSTAKLVASPITSLKVSKTTSGTYTLSWNKAKKGTGYEVQQYKNKKWQTVKTIKDLNTTTYKVKAAAGETKYRVRAYGTFNGKTVNGESKSKTVYVPKKETVKSVKGATGSFTVKYAKESKASGYEIQYAKSADFKGAKTATVSKNSTTSKKVSADKGKYYVRVRAYKTVDGKKVYGAYSASKKVTVK